MKMCKSDGGKKKIRQKWIPDQAEECLKDI